jgi:hypothetical protein
MSEMSKNMLFEKVSKAEPLLRPTDWMIAVSGATFSHPIFAGSMLGLKAAGRALNQYFGPRQAESAFQASVGAKAAGAAARSSMGIREAVGALFAGGAKGAMGQRARYVGPKTMKEFNHSVDRVNDLMSPDHQRRVKDYAEALRSAGYSQLADATVKMNANAIQYLQQGRPASTKVKNMGLTKQPKAVMPSASDMKWFRKAEVVTNPDSVLASISNGTVGKDEIDAYKAVYPSHYEELVTAARDRVAHAINAGETLDVGKVATLGLVLGSAVHPMLQKGYVDAVQATFQQQEQQQSPPPDQKPMDVTDYKTPLERTLT